MSSDTGERSTRDDLGSLATALGALADAPGGSRAIPLIAGDMIGDRYRIETLLGRGGMGVVHLARDVRLERDVAVKLCAARSADVLAPLEAEAVALAKLSHPNVVVVYEVGEIQGRVFIAMEYVAGGTARRWLGERKRTWREVIALYTAAGEGLAAAHAAGLIHRDFKPDNVLVGTDGRPRVADFGLAFSDAISHTDSVTQPGDVAGTPAYMAPEQNAGAEVDARADQYAFCATVWEGLFKVRPYAATPAPDAKVAPPQPPADHNARAVPGHIVEALRRGLRPIAADRWPAMGELLTELRRDPAARQSRIAITAGVVLLAGTAAVAVTLGVAGDHTEACEDGAARLAPIWTPERATGLATKFTEAGAASTWAIVRARTDTFARSWIAGHRAACRATRVHGSQSEAMLDRRTLCLAGARARFDASLTVLERAAGKHLADAIDVVAALPEVARCEDVAALGAQSPLPTDPAARKRIDAAMAQVEAARMTGVGSPNLEQAAAALEAARAAAWPPLIAEATMVLGGLQRHRQDPTSFQTLRSAATLGLASGSDELAAWTLADLAWDAAEDSRLDEARLWSELANGLWTRLGEPAQLGVRIIGGAALIALSSGDPTEGLALTRRQVALALRAFGDEPIEIAANHKNLASALMQASDMPQARAEIDLAVELATKALGDDHPVLARYLTTAATITANQGEWDGAIALARRSVDILTRWYGPDSIVVSDPLEMLGGALMRKGELDEASAVMERVLALREREGAAPTVDLGGALSNLSAGEVGRGNLERAIELGKRSVAIFEKLKGPEHPILAHPLVNLGYAERARNNLAESTRYLERAVAVTSTALGQSDAQTINSRIELANTLVAAGRLRDAVSTLAPSIDVIERDPKIPPHVAAEARLVFADAAWRTGDREHARAAAIAARDGYVGLGEDFTAQRDAAVAWLRSHGGNPK